MRVTGKLLSFVTRAAMAAFVLAWTQSAHAVLTGSVTNTTDPGIPPWNYVGSIGGTSGVYLGSYGGNDWVLTAAHVGIGNFTLGVTTYPAIPGSAFSITNNDSSLADLTLFRISGSPGLSNLAVAVSNPPVNTTVDMIGFGGGKSWGINTIYGYDNYTLSGYPYGGPGIITLASGEGGNGAQGEGGDSGGGLFAQSSGTWYLTGILSGVGDINDGTDRGQGTISVDFAAYYNQISADINSVSAIPEPSAYATVLGLSAALVFVARRRMVRRS